MHGKQAKGAKKPEFQELDYPMKQHSEAVRVAYAHQLHLAQHSPNSVERKHASQDAAELKTIMEGGSLLKLDPSKPPQAQDDRQRIRAALAKGLTLAKAGESAHDARWVRNTQKAAERKQHLGWFESASGGKAEEAGRSSRTIS